MAGPDVSAGPPHTLSAAAPGRSQPGPRPGPGPGLASSPDTALSVPTGLGWSATGPVCRTIFHYCCRCCPLDKLEEGRKECVSQVKVRMVSLMYMTPLSHTVKNLTNGFLSF